MDQKIAIIVALLCIAVTVLVSFTLSRGRASVKRQFTLRSFLGFVALSSIWLSQVPCAYHVLVTRDGPATLPSVTVLWVWAALGVVYVWLRVLPVLVLHCCGIVFFAVFVVSVLTQHEATDFSGLPVLVLAGCFFGSLVSFPTLILILVLRACARQRPD